MTDNPKSHRPATGKHSGAYHDSSMRERFMAPSASFTKSGAPVNDPNMSTLGEGSDGYGTIDRITAHETKTVQVFHNTKVVDWPTTEKLAFMVMLAFVIADFITDIIIATRQCTC
jgi:hypothetical protein